MLQSRWTPVVKIQLFSILLLLNLCTVLFLSGAEPAGDFLTQTQAPAPAPGTLKGFDALNEGKVADALKEFQAVTAAKPGEVPAWLGQALCNGLLGAQQASVEAYASALKNGKADPWAEVCLKLLSNKLPWASDDKPFLEAIQALLQDPQTPPRLKFLAKYHWARWLDDRGKTAEAAKVFGEIQFLRAWSLCGPFDNRDKAGFDAEYEPEKGVDFAKPVPGRNRTVSWYTPQAQPYDGIIAPPTLFEPNTHAAAYGVTHVKVDQDQWVLLHLGAGGALKAWVNGREIAKISTYNDYSPEKVLLPVFLNKGWNQLLLKSLVVEETEWAFSAALTTPDGGPVPNLTVDATAEALKQYKAENDGRAQPLLEPKAPDLGMGVRIAAAVKTNANSGWLRYWSSLSMDWEKAGDKEELPSVQEAAQAVKLAPNNPLFLALLARTSTDSNQSRHAAETMVRLNPDLPTGYSYLAEFALSAGTEVPAEDYARTAIKKFGADNAAGCQYILARLLRDRGHSAEAYRLITEYVKRQPYRTNAWTDLAELETTASGRREALKKAIAAGGMDMSLRNRLSNELAAQRKETEAAQMLEDHLYSSPFHMPDYLRVAQAWRSAGHQEKALALLEKALTIAPEAPEVLEGLSIEYQRAGQDAKAMALLKDAIRIKPNSPELKDRVASLTKGSSSDREFFANFDIDLKKLPSPKPEEYPNDNSVNVLNQTVVQVNPNGSANKMVHLVGKVLRAGGQADLNRHQIFYDPNRQVVDILKTRVITPEGREISQAEINDRTVSAARGIETRIYDEYHLKDVVFRNLEPGSTIELQYTIRDNGDNIFGDYFSDSFYMGDDQPTIKSQFVLDLPKSREFQVQPFRMKLDAQRVDSKDPAREIMKWDRDNSPGIQREPGMPPAVDLIPYVQATTMKSWEEVGLWFWNLSKDQIACDDDMKKTVKELIKDAKTDTDKLRAVHDWVIKKIRYLGIEFGRNGYKPHKASESYKALYGDCKDTATLITAMLKEAGIESRLVLVRTVDSGKIDEDTLPAPNLFNHCIAYVPDVDGKEYWIDGTTDFHQLGEIPYADQGAQVLVSDSKGGKFVRIPFGTAQENLVEQKINGTVEKSGAGTLMVHNIYRGQLAPVWRQRAETPGQFKSFLKDQAARRFPGAELTRTETAPQDSQGPMWFESEFKAPTLAGVSGDRLALFSTLDPLYLSRNFLSDQDFRKHDLEFWFPRARNMELSYQLEQGLSPDGLPETADLKEEFGFFKREVKQEGQTVRIKDSFMLNTQRIKKEEYAKFATFCRKVDAILEQKVLIKKAE